MLEELISNIVNLFYAARWVLSPLITKYDQVIGQAVKLDPFAIKEDGKTAMPLSGSISTGFC